MVGAYVYLAAYHGMYAALLRLAVKVDHAVHHAVIRNGAAVHAQLLDPVEQARNARGSVEQAVFRMHMQMSKHA